MSQGQGVRLSVGTGAGTGTGAEGDRRPKGAADGSWLAMVPPELEEARVMWATALPGLAEREPNGT